jgi:hypothetical protein
MSEVNENLKNLLPILDDFIAKDNSDLDVTGNHGYLLTYIGLDDDRDDVPASNVTYRIHPKLLGVDVADEKTALQIGGTLAMVMKVVGDGVAEMTDKILQKAVMASQVMKMIETISGLFGEAEAKEETKH